MKTLLSWDPMFKVGVEIIDFQHKELIDRLEQIQKTILITTKEEVASFFNATHEYMELHFKTEEKLMEQYNYPDVTVHKQEHAVFSAKINSFHKRFEKDNLSFVIVNIMDFMKDWIIGHILSSDKAFGVWIQNVYNKQDI
jgi:hemerythrin-like metal-binding protein